MGLLSKKSGIKSAKSHLTPALYSRRVLQLRHENKWGEISALTTVRAFAEMINRVEVEHTGVRMRQRVETLCNTQFKNLLNLDALLTRLVIPPALYLRVHVMLRCPLIPSILASDYGINQFSEWLEYEGKSRFHVQADYDSWLRVLGTWDSGALTTLLQEWQQGHEHITAAESRLSLDHEFAVLLEAQNLPGGYLITCPEVLAIKDKLPEAILSRVLLAERMLTEEIRTAFFDEVRARLDG